MQLGLHWLVGFFYLKESYMNNRHVDTLTETAYLKDDDYLITEENLITYQHILNLYNKSISVV